MTNKQIKERFAGSTAADLGGEDSANDILDITVAIPLDGYASTASDTYAIYKNLSTTDDLIVVSAQIIPTAALTASDVNYAVFTLSAGTAGSFTTAALVNTKTTSGGGSGNWTADAPVALTVSTTPANATLDPGDILKLVVTHVWDGVSYDRCTLVVKLRWV